MNAKPSRIAFMHASQANERVYNYLKPSVCIQTKITIKGYAIVPYVKGVTEPIKRIL